MKFSALERWFVFFVMLSVFCVCGEYAVTRPTSNALFLTLFSAKAYPWVWLATVPLNLLVVYCYNRFLSQIGPLRMLCTLALLTISINTLSGLFYSQFPQLIFFQYAWKDIYVLLMLKQLWSMIHSTIPANRAKYLYGFIYGMGTVGAICGSLIPALLAVNYGSEHILFFTMPIYLLLIFAYSMAFKRSGVTHSFTPEVTPPLTEAFSHIRRTPVLFAILLLGIFMQVSVGLMEYQFNAHLELNILEKDLRTAYCGKLMGLVNTLSLVFQFVGGFLMIKFLGLRGSHYLVPTLLLLSALSSFAFPTFAMVSFSFVFLKATDFSIFGVIREMLYVPLKLDAKFRAKAVIDVFAYRTSKALCSLGLLALQVLAGTYLLEFTSYISLAIFIAWIAAAAFLFRKRPEMQLSVN